MTELRDRQHSPARNAQSTDSHTSDRNLPLTEIATATDHASSVRSRSLPTQDPRWYDGVVRFWKRQVSVAVEVESRRDHLALERTFLAYLRTSLALAMIGVVTAQLFRIQHNPNPNPKFGFYVLGVPLAATFNVAALVVVLIGAWRFWRQQNAIVRGKVFAGGWEILLIMVLSILLVLVLFAVTVGVDIDKEG